MTFLKTSHDGELMIDHRNSPGLPPNVARQMGYPPELVGEGKQMYAPTLGCPHCGGHVVLNPQRKRPRAHCYKCNQYICDSCAGVMRSPDYVHRSFGEIRDMVHSGCWELHGTTGLPLLVPISSKEI
jgi:hypothetical protein